jgi:hypothetical protein
MKIQHSASLASRISRPLNGRRAPEKGITFGAALLGIICVAGLFATLALLFHAG